ncbi:hypothetical protein ROZALSC1DRAFT_21690 [Rozella allomycis CSF55]|uniref:Uncharacterized protein n=1 Tax=Rozella allomycis (strain CSF55) TaxID=988480 RepID=A0A4V1J029_ROZAC|nr:hypothetical protein ROZALSC1DRAFT_21690 [Rozella allomycis CSF55]
MVKLEKPIIISDSEPETLLRQITDIIPQLCEENLKAKHNLTDIQKIDLFEDKALKLKNIIHPIKKLKSIQRQLNRLKPYVMVIEEQYLDFERGLQKQDDVADAIVQGAGEIANKD